MRTGIIQVKYQAPRRAFLTISLRIRAAIEGTIINKEEIRIFHLFLRIMFISFQILDKE